MSAIRFRVLPRHTDQLELDKRKQTITKWRTITLFLLPSAILYVLFLIIPVIQAGYFSVYRWNGFGALENYVGLSNYERLFSHTIFTDAIGHSLLIVGLSLTVELPLALGLALLVGRGKLYGKTFFRMVFFIPFVFSEPITAIIWKYVLHPSGGLANQFFGLLVPGFTYQPWLAQTHTVMPAIFFVLVWKYFGIYMILYMAALQSIPKEMEEAARIDGANELQVIRWITLPQMGNTIRLTVFLSVLGSLQQFQIVWLLTEGGPINSSEVIVTYMYKFAIQRMQLGYGSAVAVVLFMMTLVFSLSYQRMIMSQDYDTVQV